MTWRRVWLEKRTRKKKNTYIMRWYDDAGRMRSEAVGSDGKYAERQRKEREFALNHGDDGGPKPPRLEEWVEEHLTMIDGELKASTVEDQEHSLGRLREFAGNVHIDRITPAVCRRYLAQRGKDVAPATVNKDLRTLKAIFQRAVNMRYLGSNPWHGIPQRSVPQSDKRVLSTEEIETLLCACRTSEKSAFVLLAVSTGMRKGEMQHLEWRDIDFKARAVHVRCKPDHRTKTDRSRVVPLAPALIAALRELQNDRRRHGPTSKYVFCTRTGQLRRHDVLRWFRVVVKKAGIKPCSIQDLRRTCASQLQMHGYSEAVAAKWLGHASPNTTRRYYTNILDSTLREAALAFPWSGAGPGDELQEPS